MKKSFEFTQCEIDEGVRAQVTRLPQSALGYASMLINACLLAFSLTL